ncbi:hypothetical protein AAFF_G00012480 [Aldrovandia affinis]|uniref:Uncharacterized protein n=1 Tax=Aldrovandia affinis TaxID=143900 RepID=A0AAD7S6J2_9TELE|nr:hypothetical protein AAFF_G00012480 [Aldrovandia affinis]
MQEDGKVLDGSLLGDANGVEPGPRGKRESGKWQKPRFTRKALMKCCLVKWIIASTTPQGPGPSGVEGHPSPPDQRGTLESIRRHRVIQEPLLPAGRTGRSVLARPAERRSRA